VATIEAGSAAGATAAGGVLGVSAGAITIAAGGVEAGAALVVGVAVTVYEGAPTAAAGAAAAVQCSEIMFNPVTARLFSLALLPTRFTS
jgi:hypothetical protein